MMPPDLDLSVLWQLFLHFLTLSLLAVGGGITTVPEMHRYLVGQQHWLSEAQFTTSIAIAQAAPGPNILFVAVLGWNVAGLSGAVAAMAGMLLPSTTLVLATTRWASRHRQHIGVQAFKSGMVPLTLGLLFATSWLLALPLLQAPDQRLGTLALIAGTVLLMLRTKLNLIWMVAAGAVFGLMGWV